MIIACGAVAGRHYCRRARAKTTGQETLPADALVLPVRHFVFKEAHQINHRLVWPHLRPDLLKLPRFVSDDEHIGAVGCTSVTVSHMSWEICGISRSIYSLLAPKGAPGNVPVINGQLLALSDQSFNHLTIGDSRKSSVPALKLKPSTPIRCLPVCRPCRSLVQSAADCFQVRPKDRSLKSNSFAL